MAAAENWWFAVDESAGETAPKELEAATLLEAMDATASKAAEVKRASLLGAIEEAAAEALWGAGDCPVAALAKVPKFVDNSDKFVNNLEKFVEYFFIIL